MIMGFGMRKITGAIMLVIVMLLFLVAMINFVYADGDEAFIEIDITYFNNFDPPGTPPLGDMSSDVFVGEESEPFGSDEVVIPLTSGGEPIIDPTSSDDVPGLHVLRGQDETGNFIEISSYGFNSAETRESVKFEVELQNSIFMSIVNEAGGGGYEGSGDDSCGIEEGNPENDVTGDDEFSIEIGGTTGSFCAVTNTNRDRIRLYYIVEISEPLMITNLFTNPELPLVNNGNEQNIEIGFDSNRYPLDIAFTLFNAAGVSVDMQGPIEVNSANELPVTYTIPGNLAEETYELHMTIEDLKDNGLDFVLGSIIVVIEDDEDDDNGDDGRRGGGRRGPIIAQSYKPPIKNTTINVIPEQEMIKLGEIPAQKSNLWLWIYILIILIIILVILVVVFALIK